ncbi:MAG: permease [Verrucomicrobiota bacterium]|nr:permease [Verrucomicrobiota bacterium]
MRKKGFLYIISFFFFIFFIGLSYFIDYENGQKTGFAFVKVLTEMLKILTCAFILIGLFEVWIKKEVVIKHLGEDGGLRGYFWVLLLAGFSVGGLYVGFPLAETLQKKGASLKVIFAYLGFVGVCRIPMTIFEISFLGLPFTFVRLMITIPLFLLIGVLMGIVLKKKGYSMEIMR